MAKRTLLASAASFAHLFGRGAAAETPEDDDDKKQRRGESDEDYAKRMEDDDADAARAEDDADEGMDEDESDEDDDGDEKPKKGKKAKKAKKAEEPKDEDDDDDSDSEDDEDEDDDGNEEAEKRGRKAERARWTQVLQHPAAGDRGTSACHLLATTGMSAKRIVGLLQTMPKQGATGRGRLSERMQATRTPNPGGDSNGTGRAGSLTLAQQIVAAGQKRRGEKA